MKKSWWAFLTVGFAAWALAACSSPSGERPTIDARALVDGPLPGMIDAAPGMIDAAPGMIDAAPGMIDAAPVVADAAVDAAPVVVDAAVDAAPVMIDAAVDAAPVVIDAAVDAAPVGVDAAVDAAPVVVDAAVDAAPPPDAPPDAPPPPPTGHLRLMAGNLTSGNQQAYLAPGIHIFRGLAPDVAMVQEFNVGTNSAADLRGFVDQAFGPEFSFVRGAPAQIPNGIVSRYPIIASGEWFDTEVSNRDFVWARIDIPGPTDLFAVSVHLLTSGASVRNVEAGELVQNIQGLPAGAFVVLGGDFNTDSRSEACIQTLSQVLTTTGPFPVDQASNGNTNANRNKPYDWVLVNPALHALETGATVGNNVFGHGLVVDTRGYAPIADLAPALVGDSDAVNMQHMGVVRDFALPGAPPQPTVQVTAPNGGETWAAASSQTIRWTASGVTNVSVELSLDGTTFSTLSASTPAAAGQLTVTAPMVMTAAARVRVTAVPGGTPSDVSDAPFTITLAPPPVGRVFLNEVLANEPGSDVTKEFVELVNSGSGDASLAGWTISDAVSVRHTFAAGTVLRAGQALVVFGSAAGIPAGLGNAIGSSTGQLNLSNSGDTVTLASPTAMVDSVTYTSVLSSTDGVSMNRNPDGSAAGTFVLHTTLTTAVSSPGTRTNGAAF